MLLKSELTNRRKFLERSAMGVGGLLFSSVLLESCTDHIIDPDPGTFPGISILNRTTSPLTILFAQSDESAVPALRYYEKNLIQLSNGGSGEILAPLTTGNFQIPVVPLSEQFYIELIIALPNFYYPITIARRLYNAKTKSYDSIEVTDEDIANMQKSELFYRLMKAFPSSEWAKNFQDLLSYVSDSSMTQAAVDEASKVYFNSLNGYNNVTLANLSLLGSYYRRYINGYVDYQTNRTQYLYSADGSNVKYIGSVKTVINQSSNAVVLSFTDPNNAVKPLYYVDGFCVDDALSEKPSVCLVGSFIIQSRLTNEPSDQALVPTLVGVVDGISVFATDQKPSESHSWFYLLLHPKTAFDYINLFLLIAGAVTGIDALLVSFELAVILDRTESQSNGSLVDLILKANEDRLARLSSQQGKGIPVDTSIDDIPSF